MEHAHAVLGYFRENVLAVLVISLIAGFGACKTVMHERRLNSVLYLLVGLMGCFIGQYASRATGLKELLDNLPMFWILFDFLLAYAGSFIIAAAVHFVKPL
jgi:uncharacterized membrane protein YeaQ/YmgE (transglycosylase-associated protein family)